MHLCDIVQKMTAIISKIKISAAVFVLLLIPIVSSSLLDLGQKKIERELSEQAKIAQEMEEKIYLTGKFDPSARRDFVLVQSEDSVTGNRIYLRKETYTAFRAMQDTAGEARVELKIASGTRNFDYQKNIWDKKWLGYTRVEGYDLSKTIPEEKERFKKILEYSAAPGTSRHHWGTDIDINNANPEYFETEEGKKVYGWLHQNASFFGFCQTYNVKGGDRSTGYSEEKWHWSYMPLSRNFLQRYGDLIKESDIGGFLGEESAPLNLIDNYVLGINPKCV